MGLALASEMVGLQLGEEMIEHNSGRGDTLGIPRLGGTGEKVSGSQTGGGAASISSVHVGPGGGVQTTKEESASIQFKPPLALQPVAALKLPSSVSVSEASRSLSKSSTKESPTPLAATATNESGKLTTPTTREWHARLESARSALEGRSGGADGGGPVALSFEFPGLRWMRVMHIFMTKDDSHRANNTSLDNYIVIARGLYGSERVREQLVCKRHTEAAVREMNMTVAQRQLLPVLEEVVHLAIGVPVMTLVNNSGAGYLNGSRGYVKALGYSTGPGGAVGREHASGEQATGPGARLQTGMAAGACVSHSQGCREVVTVDVELMGSDGKPRVVQVRRCLSTLRRLEGGKHILCDQFPLQLGFALTAHKAQGLEFELVMVHAGGLVPKGREGARKGGLLYTAMSRVKSASGLLLDMPEALNSKAMYDHRWHSHNLSSLCKTSVLALEELAAQRICEEARGAQASRSTAAGVPCGCSCICPG